MKVLIDLLHLLLCQKAHEHDMLKLSEGRPEVCYYYLECDISGGEEMADHLEWASTSNHFKSAMGFSTTEEALEFVKEGISITQDIRTLVGDNKLKLDFLMSLLT